MTEKILELRKEAAELSRMAELPVNAPIRDRMILLAAKYDELASEREAMKRAQRGG